jgi:phosphatidylserine/phosphatidylglycerophosphate/cardiolipin synthase-like enzyme
VAALTTAIERIDRAVGDRVAAGVRHHHERRLRKLGSDALDPPAGGWARGNGVAPPRDGAGLEMLVDGEAALRAMVDAVRSAVSHVHLTAWFLTPGFVMTDGEEGPVVVRELLAEAARRADVRVLLWAGAPLPVFQPSRRSVRAVRDELTAVGTIHCALDSRERPLHCHHEKTLVVDDRVAFVGGIDWTSFSGDRRDSQRHPARAALGWHDASVRITGPPVADVAGHFAMRWHAVTGERLAPAAAPEPVAGGVTAQFVRTCPEHVYPALHDGSFGVLESYVRALRSAERLIYLESQYLWSPEIVAVLADKLRRPPDDRFRLVVVLPSRPKGGGDDTRGALGELMDADGGAGRMLGCCLFASGAGGADPVYVHAKVGIVDDRWLTVGSANLNDHSLFNDTEANVVTDDPELARRTRLELWAEHLERPVEEIAGDPADVVDHVMRPLAEEQLQRRLHGLPPTRRLGRLDHVSRRSHRLLGPLQGLVVDG